jgi:transcriptional regulator with XRE-family HTH domain
MISVDKRREFLDEIQNEEYRHDFASENVGVALAFQINLMREGRGWTQGELAQRSGKAQETISQLENPNYGKYTLNTLKRLARAFDVALLVRFVSFGELADWTVNVSPSKLAPPSYPDERQMSFSQVSGNYLWPVAVNANPLGNTVLDVIDTQSLDTAMLLSPKFEPMLRASTAMGLVVVNETLYKARIVERKEEKKLAAA